jgi:hypothetical protein
MIHADIVKALTSLMPESQWTLAGDDYADLVWLSQGTAPTLVEIQAEIALIPQREKAKADKAETDKAALLAKLGITADEAKLLLG